MKKLLAIALLILGCSGALADTIPDQRPHNGIVHGKYTGQVIAPQYLSPIAPNGSAAATIDVRAYGAIANAKKLLQCTLGNANTNLSCSDANFTPNDAGKSIKVYDYVNGTYPFQGTLSAYGSGTTFTTSGNSTAACLAGNCIVYYGSDDTVFINNAFAAAAAMANNLVNDPNFPKGSGAPRVVFPIDSNGDGYMFNSTLTTVCCNVTIDADAMLFSNTGTGASDRNWAMNFASSTNIKHLVMEVGGGMGILIGTNSTTNSSTRVDDLQLWHVGSNYNAGASPTSQISLEITGYDFEIKKFWTKGGNIGFYANSASDISINEMELIGTVTGFALSTVESLQATSVVCDTNSNICGTIDGTHSINMTIRGFSVNSTTVSNMLQIGGFDTTDINRGLNITLIDQRAGAQAMSVAYTQDSTFNLNLTNSALYTGAGANITTGVAYGSGNVGSLNINMNRDPNNFTNPYTGTITGTLRDISNGVEKDYTAVNVIRNPATTYEMMMMGGLR